ncbi:hypothetical protein BU16DRAFT_488651, partial [Lophium mytilinum]
MDAFNLKTASTYINNLLLARGLLRDGKPIEFARPSKTEGGKEVALAQIINLVHDLILKRDRDQTHHSALAQTISTTRAEATAHALRAEKLQTHADDLARQLSLSQSQDRAARTALRTAESSARALREEMLRLKTTLAQVRTACANDVRKRDVQIQRLKTHLTAQQRGNKTGLVGASITITPGAGGKLGSGREEEVVGGLGVEDPGYELRQETTEFLTQLSQGLSDENDSLIGLVRGALGTLRELQGMEGCEGLEMVREKEEGEVGGMVNALPTSYEALAADMDAVLENLKNLLTNPNFVPIDEVELREEEIVRLRQGWEKMETRWREAIAMMDGWRKRMASGGDTVNIDELKMGLGLSVGLESPSKEDISILTDNEEEMDSEGLEDIEEEGEPSSLEYPSFPEPAVTERTTNSDIFNIHLQPAQPALREGDGNVKSPRKVAFAPSATSTPSQDADENASEIDLVGSRSSGKDAAKAKSQAQAVRSRPRVQESRIPRQVGVDDTAELEHLARTVTLSSPAFSLDAPTDLYIDNLQAQKRLSSPRPHPEERSPKLTVQDKLNVAQAEAEATALADGLVRASPAAEALEDAGDQQAGPQNRRRSSPRKTRVGGRPKRRKSTLTPEELQTLL